MARNGENGRGADCYGKGGDDITLRMPVGTTITDMETGELIADLTEHNQSVKIARGRCGRFRQPALQVQHEPRAAPENGRQARRAPHGARSNSKVLADVGLLGMPNAGKSTFISLGIERAAEDCRLSVHHARAESRRGARGAEPQLRDRGHSRPDRRRG